jgi:hypothetical protein
MSRLLLLVFVIACGGKPAAQAPSNTGSNDTVPVAAPVDKCAEQKTCVACIAASTDDPNAGSCQWDGDKQACAVACEAGAKNCLLVGAKNIGEQRASEVCSSAKQAP